jgi:hypothetical protein
VERVFIIGGGEETTVAVFVSCRNFLACVFCLISGCLSVQRKATWQDRIADGESSSKMATEREQEAREAPKFPSTMELSCDRRNDDAHHRDDQPQKPDKKTEFFHSSETALGPFLLTRG